MKTAKPPPQELPDPLKTIGLGGFLVFFSTESRCTHISSFYRIRRGGASRLRGAGSCKQPVPPRNGSYNPGQNELGHLTIHLE